MRRKEALTLTPTDQSPLDIFIPSYLFPVLLLQREEMYPYAIALVEGKILNWQEPETAYRIGSLTRGEKSPVNRFMASLVRQPGHDTARALGVLTDDFGRLSQVDSSSLLHEAAFYEFFSKLSLGLGIADLLRIQRHFDPARKSDQEERFIEVVDQNYRKLLSAVELCQRPDDLAAYLHFEDVFAKVRRESSPLLPIDEASLDDEMAKMPSIDQQKRNAVVATIQEVNPVRKELQEVDYQAWERIKNGWQWRHVNCALSLLPTLRSPNVRLNLALALEENLMSDTASPTTSDLTPGLDEQIEGLKTLLSHNLAGVKQGNIVDFYPLLLQKLQDEQGLPGLSVPEQYLPSAVIAYFSKLGQYEEGETLERAIGSLHQRVAKDPNTFPSWLCTLVALKSLLPESSETIQTILGEWKLLPDHYRAILLNQESGSLRFSPKDQRIHARKRHGDLPFYTSLKPEEMILFSHQKSSPTIEEVPVATESASLPFFGEAQIAKKSSVPRIIEGMFQQANPQEGNALLDVFDALSRKWQTANREGIFVFSILVDPSNPALLDAKRFGIESIIINKANAHILFLLNNKHGSVGIAARLDEKTGELHIDGMDDSFIGREEHLALNNLALLLATQKFYQGEPKDNTFLAGWNRSSRNGLPKLKKTGMGEDAAYFVAAEVAGHDLMVCFVVD